jgi:putative SOS response-associated peptidase YedK
VLWQRTFTIITSAPNELVAQVHDRMPVIVQGEHADEWLFQGNDPATITPLLQPIPSDHLVATAVCPRVNSVRHGDPACLEPVPYPLPVLQERSLGSTVRTSLASTKRAGGSSGAKIT